MIFGQTTPVDSDRKCKFQRFCPARNDCINVARGILSCYKLGAVYMEAGDPRMTMAVCFLTLIYTSSEKRPLTSDHIKGSLVAAFRSPLMKALDRSVETLGL